jgi:hypothetical protein
MFGGTLGEAEGPGTYEACDLAATFRGTLCRMAGRQR